MLKTIILGMLSILALLCLVIAYALVVGALDKLYPSLGDWLWISATIPIIAAGSWVALSPDKSDLR